MSKDGIERSVKVGLEVELELELEAEVSEANGNTIGMCVENFAGNSVEGAVGVVVVSSGVSVDKLSFGPESKVGEAKVVESSTSVLSIAEDVTGLGVLAVKAVKSVKVTSDAKLKSGEAVAVDSSTTAVLAVVEELDVLITEAVALKKLISSDVEVIELSAIGLVSRVHDGSRVGVLAAKAVASVKVTPDAKLNVGEDNVMESSGVADTLVEADNEREVRKPVKVTPVAKLKAKDVEAVGWSTSVELTEIDDEIGLSVLGIGAVKPVNVTSDAKLSPFRAVAVAVSVFADEEGCERGSGREGGVLEGIAAVLDVSSGGEGNMNDEPPAARTLDEIDGRDGLCTVVERAVESDPIVVLSKVETGIELDRLIGADGLVIVGSTEAEDKDSRELVETGVLEESWLLMVPIGVSPISKG